MSTVPIKPPLWFWIISVISLLWNLGGVMAFVMQVTISPESLQAMPEDERTMYTTVPILITLAFAIGSLGSALGSILLLLRKQLATMVFVVSLIAILIQMSYVLFVSNALQLRGPGAAVLPVSIIVIAGVLVWFSRRAKANGWIN